MKVSELTGKPIPAALEMERGRLVDAMTDSSAYLHGKTFSVFGDPDFCMGVVGFVMELGAEPMHVLATNGSKVWAKKMKKRCSRHRRSGPGRRSGPARTCGPCGRC